MKYLLSNTISSASMDATNLSNFQFILVEETPLMKNLHSWIIVSLAFIILIIGLLINARIYFILSKHKRDAAIDRLFLSNTIFSLMSHPQILAYYIFRSAEICCSLRSPQSQQFSSNIVFRYLDTFSTYFTFSSMIPNNVSYLDIIISATFSTPCLTTLEYSVAC